MRACKVCGKQYRTGRIAFIVTDKGLKAARVCQPCAGKGVLLVVARPAVTREVEKGPPVAAEVLKNLRAQVRALKATINDPGYQDDAEGFISGQVEGLENAISALTKGRREPLLYRQEAA